MQTIAELLSAIDELDLAPRDAYVARLEAILEMTQEQRAVALGLLALDLCEDRELLRWRPRPGDRTPSTHAGQGPIDAPAAGDGQTMVA